MPQRLSNVYSRFRLEKENLSNTPGHGGNFVTTRWTLVVAAGREGSPESLEALSALCHAYWYPIYAYVRRAGNDPHDAQDLTQEFFARFLERNDFSRARRERGRFRSFLHASLKHFLVNEWKRAHRVKRGGGRRILSLDEAAAEGRYACEPKEERSPDKIFERRWAMTLLDQAVLRLREEYVENGAEPIFEALKSLLTDVGSAASHAETARKLNMSEAAVKMAASRLRRRYRDILRVEIAQTVASPEEVDDEIKHLFSVLAAA